MKKYIFQAELEHTVLSDRCGECPYCIQRPNNRDQHSCELFGYVVDPKMHDYRCKGRHYEINENGEVKDLWQY